MRKFLLALFITGLSVSGISAQNMNTEFQTLTNADKAFSLSRFWSEVKYSFVYYDKLKFNLDSLYQSSLNIMLNSKSDKEYYFEFMRFAALLNDGHTEINPPIHIYNKYRAKIPIRTKLVENKVFVRSVKNDTLIAKGIVKGVEILKIDGIDVHKYAQDYILPYISSSTDHYKKAVAYDSELTKGDIDKPITLTLRNPQGKVFEETISRYMSEKGDELAEYKGTQFEQIIEFSKFQRLLTLLDNGLSDVYTYKKLKNNIGYLHISSFMGNFPKFDELYEQIKETNALIIDVRGNIGGNSQAAQYILKHLTDTEFESCKSISRKYIPMHASWGMKAEWYESPPHIIKPFTKEDKKEIYTKPVIVLSDEKSISAADDFCADFRTMKRGKIVGTKTAGSSGNPLQFFLPDGCFAMVCTLKEFMPDGTEIIGVGVLPDIEVKETIESFLSGRDLPLEKALEILENK